MYKIINKYFENSLYVCIYSVYCMLTYMHWNTLLYLCKDVYICISQKSIFIVKNFV